jgi:mono/diheme cytochrome c family protein
MPRWMDRHHWNPRGMGPDMNARMQRHWTYMHEGLPAEYAGQRSTVAANEATVAEGGKLYAANCASCHGKTGLGDGEAGKSLAPSPALLAYLIQRPVAADEYLLWSIAEGGKAFGTGMPAFKDTLKRDDIWRIVGYMRAGFPEVKDGAAGKAK